MGGESILAALNPVCRMAGVEQTVAGDPAPGWQVLRRAGVPGDKAQHLPGLQGPHPAAQGQQQIAAAQVSGIPICLVAGGAIVRSG